MAQRKPTGNRFCVLEVYYTVTSNKIFSDRCNFSIRVVALSRHRHIDRLLGIETTDDYMPSLDLRKTDASLMRPDGTVELFRS